MAKAAGQATITINPMFSLLLWINALLCVVTLAIMVWTSIEQDPLPKARERLFNACEHVFTMTAGAFIGLLGGRASIPDPKQK